MVGTTIILYFDCAALSVAISTCPVSQSDNLFNQVTELALFQFALNCTTCI
jgi:hypothetical protein